MIYICSQGDTWDSIAYRVYGDEFLFPQIMVENRDYADFVLFNGGEKISIPDRVYIENTLVSTPWQNGNTVRVIEAPW